MIKIPYGIAENIGWRESMEDEHAIYEDWEKGFFSAEIYDGHGGKSASRIASEMLTPYFLHAWSKESDKRIESRRKHIDIIREAYLAVDNYIIENRVGSGTTAAVFYIFENGFIASNVGDTRIVIGVLKGARTLTRDHRPGLADERERIERLGGAVITLDVPRVQGMLSVSRSLGDMQLKPFISSEPEITEGYFGRENDYAVLACDGVWDVLAAEDVIEFVRKSKNPQKGAEIVVDEALNCGSTDNVTVIVLDLRERTGRIENESMNIT